MARGRNEAEWDRTASVLAMLENCHRDPEKSRPVRPADHHPYHRKAKQPEGIVIDKSNVGLMREAFVGK